MTRAGRVRVVAAALAGVLLAGCTSGSAGRLFAPSTPGSRASASSASSTPASSPSSTTTPGPSASTSPPACPSSYAAPDPARPHVALHFTLAADHATVRGTEVVRFRPDLPVTELVFRLTANTRPTVDQGNAIRVDSASATPAGGRYGFTAAGADPSTQGGLLRIPLGRTVAPGQEATARIAFTLTLGRGSFDRFGRAGDFAWFGSGQPLLAWERGYGWHTEDLIAFTAESATSEAADTSVTVVAPARDTVIASGDPADPARTSAATRTWTSSLPAARDVAVAVGPFSTSDVTVGRTRLRLGAPSAAERDSLVPEFQRALRELSSRFGPFPFPSLAVARVPAGGGGIEYPGSILMLDASRLVAVHETAHQWFYAMVGDSQSQHPWLDEAFAQYAEELVDGVPPHRQDLRTPLPVDRSVQAYGTDENGYYFTTYSKGSAALEAARDAAGAVPFDRALRCYVARNAWRIVDPDDLEAALAGLPAAVRVLRQAGALR